MAWAHSRRGGDRWLGDARRRLARALGAAGRLDEVSLDEIERLGAYRVTARCRVSGSPIELWAQGDPDQALGELEREARRVALDLAH